MKVMVLIKATTESEAGQMPSEQALTEMMDFNEELVKSGVMLAGDGLHPSAKGARVNFEDDKVTVTDGPFTETKEMIAGYWLWQVRSMEEAKEWAKRIPNTDLTHGQVELRPVFEPEDFGENLTAEVREKEQKLRAQVEANQ